MSGKPSPLTGLGVDISHERSKFNSLSSAWHSTKGSRLRRAVAYAAELLEDQDRIARMRESLKGRILIHPDAPRLNHGHVIAAIIRGASSLEEIFNEQTRSRFQAADPDFLPPLLKEAIIAEQMKVARAAYTRLLDAAWLAVTKAKLNRLPELPEDLLVIFDHLRGEADESWEKEEVDVQNKHSRYHRLVPEICQSDMHFWDIAITRSCPMSRDLLPDLDTQRAAFVSVLYPDLSDKIQQEALELVEAIAETVDPFQRELDTFRPFHAKRVAPNQRSLVIDILARIQQYDDKDLGWDVFWGFRIVGKINKSNVFPPNRQEELAKNMLNIDDGAEGWNKRLAKNAKFQEGDEIVRWKTNIEMDRLESSGQLSYSECDKIFEGKWRALGRFPAWSADKYRECDDAKKSKHNDSTFIWERIICEDIMSVDRFARLQFFFWKRLPHDVRLKTFQLNGFTEDLKRAYRQCAVALEHLRYNTVNYRQGNQSVFVIVYALVFGLTSAVIQFNRVSRFLSFASRRWLMILVTNYYDDFFNLAGEKAAKKIKHNFKEFVRSTGFWLDEGKGSLPAAVMKWLGVMKELRTDKIITTISDGRRDKLNKIFQAILYRNWLPPSLAASVRGKFGFSSTTFVNKCGRAGLAAMSERQYQDDKDEDYRLTARLKYTVIWMQWLISLAHTIPRTTIFDSTNRPLWHIFTDASAEPIGGGRRVHYKGWDGQGDQIELVEVMLGWLIHAPNGTITGGCHKLAENVVKFWAKQQPIAPGEILGAFQAILCADLQDGCDICLWVDNEVAKYCFIKGSCRDDCCDALVGSLMLYLASRDIRLWVEYVPSEMNPADDPSRGVGSPLCQCPETALALQLLPTSDVFQAPSAYMCIATEEMEQFATFAMKQESLIAAEATSNYYTELKVGPCRRILKKKKRKQKDRRKQKRLPRSLSAADAFIQSVEFNLVTKPTKKK